MNKTTSNVMSTVSIIMPCFNSQKFIGEAINSVLAQTFLDWELIIVDGGSSDNSIALIEGYCESDPRIKLLQNEDDQGPAHARKLGILRATGSFIAFLDSDDIWHPDKLFYQVSFMKQNNINFSYTLYGDYSHNSANEITRYYKCNESFNYTQALVKRGIGCLTVVIHRSLFSDDILNVKNTSHGEDYLWWLLILKKGETAHGLMKPLALYRDNPNSISKKRFSHYTTLWSSYRELLGLGVTHSMVAFLMLTADKIFRNDKI